MRTYQDLMLINPKDEQARIAFVRSIISEHQTSEAYKMAVTADEYDHKRNTTIMRYEKTMRTLTGREVADIWSPNHKTTRNFFNRFTTQQNQYLLGNGVTWENEATGDKLGEDFDTQLQKAGKKALVQGESFGFFNLDHLEVFELKEFAPLYDEENGSLRAGVRFWQIDESKPLRATLYEEDGYTGYIWGERDAQGEKTSTGRVYTEKKAYITKISKTEEYGTEIYDGENYPTFPIIPLWGNKNHQSELVGIREQIDAYDLIKNGFLNDLDTAQIYWIIKGAGGMDDPDLAQFMQKLKSTHFASVDEGQDAQPVEVNIPYAARETLLDRIEKDLYKDYGALNVEEIRSGAVTATQILAAYEPLNEKADDYEYCIIEFIQGILKVAGIEDSPTFTRSKLVNVSEEIQTVLQASEVLEDDYVTRKVLTLLGDGDQADTMLEEMAANELEIGEVTPTRNASMYEITSVLGKLKRGDITERTAMAMLQRIGLSEEEAQETIDMQSEEESELLEEELLEEEPIEEEIVEEEPIEEDTEEQSAIAQILEKLKKLMKELG